MGIPNAGLVLLSGLTGGVGAPAAATYAAYGTGTTAFATSQTTLVAETARAAATVTQATTTATNDTTQWTKAFTIGGTLTIGEVGVFNHSSTGSMLTRDVLSSPKSVVSGDTYTPTVKLVFARP